MHFSKHYFITITIVVLAILIIQTTAFNQYRAEFSCMFIFIEYLMFPLWPSVTYISDRMAPLSTTTHPYPISQLRSIIAYAES